jgi:hypothetical protein
VGTARRAGVIGMVRVLVRGMRGPSRPPVGARRGEAGRSLGVAPRPGRRRRGSRQPGIEPAAAQPGRPGPSPAPPRRPG